MTTEEMEWIEKRIEWRSKLDLQDSVMRDMIGDERELLAEVRRLQGEIEVRQIQLTGLENTFAKTRAENSRLRETVNQLQQELAARPER
jgi:predicted nuclease with TOPRIM domain